MENCVVCRGRDPSHEETLNQILRLVTTLVRKSRILPKAFLVEGVTCWSKEHPVKAGGYADIFRGTLALGGEGVALKRLRIFLNDSPREREKKVSAFLHYNCRSYVQHTECQKGREILQGIIYLAQFKT